MLHVMSTVVTLDWNSNSVTKEISLVHSDSGIKVY